MDDPVERKLAAILAADVVGYSRLMGADERGTHARLKALRGEFIEPTTAVRRGRIVKLMGDGMLVEFPSAVDAVECAVAIQNGVAERNADSPEDRQIRLRIGINIGDIIIEADDIYGDGVNIAARLEGLAEPGGVCVARNVYNQVRNKVAFDFEPMGEHQVKNIAEPVAVFRVIANGAARPAARPARRAGLWPWAGAAAAMVLMAIGGGAWWYMSQPISRQLASEPWKRTAETGSALPLPDKPSIVVLPFRDMSDASEHEHFADALTDEIITGLARFDDLFVISSNSSFRYKGEAVDIKEIGRELGVRFALEGSVQRFADRLRVTAQLIDATTDEHLWAETYNRELTAANFFEVQDAIAGQVVGTLGGFDGRLAASASEIAKRKNTDSLEAYELYILATHMKQHEFTEDAHKKMAGYFRKAIEKDPDFALPYMGLGWMEMRAFWGGWSPDPQKTLEQALEYGQKALALDPSHAMVHLLLGDVYASMGQLDRGIAEHDKARALNPNDPDIMKEAAGFLAFAGRTDEAIELQTDAMRLDPFYPDTYLWNAAIIYYTARDYDAVIDAVERMREPPVDALLFMAAGYAQVGRTTEAEATIKRVLELDPEATVAKWAAQQPYKNPEDLQHYTDGLRKAGLPGGGLTN